MQIFNFIVSNDEVGRSLYSTPGVPSARLAAMRGVFQKMLIDPEFKSEAERLRLEVDPKTGEEMQQIVDAIFKTSDGAIDKIRAVMAR